MQDNHIGVILKDIHSKQQLVLEVLVPLAQDMNVIKPKVEKLSEDMEVVKAVQKEQGRGLKRLNDRVGRVETGLDHVETKIDKVETRLGKVEAKLGRVETRLGHVEDYLVEQGMPQRAYFFLQTFSLLP